MGVARQGTLLIVSGPRHDPSRRHLHVVVNDPDVDGNVLLLAICSVTAAPHDATCVLQPHEHPFLKHPSYVFYARATLASAAALQDGIARQEIAIYSDLNTQSFLRLRNGICRSPLTPLRIKRYLGCV